MLLLWFALEELPKEEPPPSDDDGWLLEADEVPVPDVVPVLELGMVEVETWLEAPPPELPWPWLVPLPEDELMRLLGNALDEVRPLDPLRTSTELPLTAPDEPEVERSSVQVPV